MAGPLRSMAHSLSLFLLAVSVSSSLVLAAENDKNATVPFSSYVFNPGKLSNLTVAVNVPEKSTTEDDLYFHFTAPAAQQWSAFGFGSSMSNALVFMAYAGSGPSDVTVSPRIASGHSLPKLTQDVNVTLLSGSGITDGVLVVNAKCEGCRKWGDSGSVDVESSSQALIWAVGPIVSNFASDDLDAKLKMHEGKFKGTFSLDMKKATGEGGVPVLPVSSTGSTGGGSTSPGSSSPAKSSFPVAVHAFLMIGAFLIAFPGGYMVLRVFEKIWLHMGMQTLGLLLVVGGTVSGVMISMNGKSSPSFNSTHQILGLVIAALVLLSWLLGFIGHRIYKSTGRPPIITKIHRFVGPTTIMLGLINVCIGFSFAGYTGRAVGFSIVVVAMFLFMGGVMFFLKKRKSRKEAMNTPAAQNFQEAFNYPPPPAPPVVAGYDKGPRYYQEEVQMNRLLRGAT